MTFRSVIRATLLTLGGGLILGLLRAGAPLHVSGGWYVIGLLVLLSGLLPEETGWVTGLAGGGLLLYLYATGHTAVGGLHFVHGLFLLVLSAGLRRLGEPDVAVLVRCNSCYWKGPVTALRRRRCPVCGNPRVTETGELTLRRL